MRFGSFIRVWFQEDRHSLVPGFFHRIPWRRGTLGQKFGGNYLSQGAIQKHRAAMKTKDTVLGIKHLCFVIVLILFKLGQMCLSARDCIVRTLTP